ncbi:MAG: 50S ribosomal protein L10 [Limnochordales bacterium]
MPRPEKVAAVEEIRGQLQASKAVFVTDYRGLTVAEMTRLRRKLREAGAEYKVVKNPLTRLAAAETDAQALEPLLVGPTALAFAKEDPVAAAKALNEFVRESRVLEIRGGVLGGKPLSVQDVQALADLPPREVLLAQVVGGFQAPIAGFVSVLQGTLRKLVYALDAVRQQKEQAA